MVTIRDYLIPQPIWWQSCDNLRIWWQSCDYLITCYHLLSIIGFCFFVGKNTFAVCAPKLWPRVLHVGFPPCDGSDLLAIHLTRSTAWNGKKMQIIYSQLKSGNLVVFVIDLLLWEPLFEPSWLFRSTVTGDAIEFNRSDILNLAKFCATNNKSYSGLFAAHHRECAE